MISIRDKVDTESLLLYMGNSSEMVLLNNDQPLGVIRFYERTDYRTSQT